MFFVFHHFCDFTSICKILRLYSTDRVFFKERNYFFCDILKLCNTKIESCSNFFNSTTVRRGVPCGAPLVPSPPPAPPHTLCVGGGTGSPFPDTSFPLSSVDLFPFPRQRKGEREVFGKGKR